MGSRLAFCLLEVFIVWWRIKVYIKLISEADVVICELMIPATTFPKNTSEDNLRKNP